jgi:hypothetical protein
MEIREVILPSGAVLKINPAPYSPAKQLFVACMKEIKAVDLGNDINADLGLNLIKDLFCSAISSPEIEKAMIPCLKAALYNELPISDKTFEPVEARQDYFQVMYEVAKENVLPFFPKNLLSQLSESMKKSQGSSNPK